MAKRDEKWLSEIGRFFFPFLGKDCGVWWRLWKQKDKKLCKARTWHARAKNAFSKVKAPSISENSKRIHAKVKYRPTLLIGFATNSGSSTTSKKTPRLHLRRPWPALRRTGLLTSTSTPSTHSWVATDAAQVENTHILETTLCRNNRISKNNCRFTRFFLTLRLLPPIYYRGMTTHCHRLSSQTGNLRGRRKEWQDAGTTSAVQLSLLLSLPYFLRSH